MEERGSGKPWSEIIESFPRRSWRSLAGRYRKLTKGLSPSKSSHNDYNRDLYTPDEDQLLIEAKEAGLSWEEITQLFEGRRTTSSLKSHFYLFNNGPPKTIAPYEYSHFTPDEDNLLLEAKDAGFSWKEIFKLFEGQRTLSSLKKRFHIVGDPAGQKRFTPEEDELLFRSRENGMAWKEISELFKGQRTEGSLLRRYLRLGGSVAHKKFTPDEDKLLLDARGKGMIWKDVAELFQGRRTADALRLRYYKLIGKIV